MTHLGPARLRLLCSPLHPGIARTEEARYQGYHAEVKGWRCSPGHPLSVPVCRGFLRTYVVCGQELVVMTTGETDWARP